MKKKILLTLFAILLSLPVAASASSVGNPDTLGEPGAIALGLEYDNSHTNMQLKHGSISDGDMTSSFGHGDMQLNSDTLYATITVGILPRLDAYAGMGVNNSDIGLTAAYSGGGSDHFKLDDNAVVAYKVGVKGKVAEVAGIQIGASAQYSGLKLDKKFSVNGHDLSTMFFYPASYTTKTKVRKWQAAVTASKQMGRFSPYVGLIAESVSADHTTNARILGGEGPAYAIAINAKAKQESLYTGVIGANVSIVENLDLTAEFRNGNEDAFTAALNYKF